MASALIGALLSDFSILSFVLCNRLSANFVPDFFILDISYVFLVPKPY